MTRLCALALPLLIAAGCYQPYLKVGPGVPPPPGARAWVESFTLHLTSSANLAERAVFAQQVDRFTDSLSGVFEAHRDAYQGFEPYFDAARSKKMGDADLLNSTASAFIAAAWTHPETFHMPVTPLSMRAGFAEKVDSFEPEFQDAIMSVRVAVSWGPTLLAFRETRARVTIDIFDRTGNRLFASSSQGEAGLSFGFTDYSPATVGQAVDAALVALGKLKVERLESLDGIVFEQHGPPRAVALAKR